MSDELKDFIEEREEKHREIDALMSEGKEQAFDDSTARQMAERVSNFLGAHHDPDKKIGEKRAQRKANPDFVAPEPVGEARFDQKDKEDRWSRTEYREGDHGSGHAAITVQDPADPDDLVCTHIGEDKHFNRVDGEEEREVHPEKISQLQVEDDRFNIGDVLQDSARNK